MTSRSAACSAIRRWRTRYIAATRWAATLLAADRCYTQEELSELAFALHRFMMTRPDPWAFLARAQETVRLTGEAFEQSPRRAAAGGFCGAQAGAPLRQRAGDAGALRGGKRPAALRGGLRHGCAAHGGSGRGGGGRLCRAARRAARCDVRGAGAKEKTDLFDEDIADRVKARRDALKKAVADVQTAFALTLEDAAADIRRRPRRWTGWPSWPGHTTRSTRRPSASAA